MSKMISKKLIHPGISKKQQKYPKVSALMLFGTQHFIHGKKDSAPEGCTTDQRE